MFLHLNNLKHNRFLGSDGKSLPWAVTLPPSPSFTAASVCGTLQRGFGLLSARTRDHNAPCAPQAGVLGKQRRSVSFYKHSRCAAVSSSTTRPNPSFNRTARKRASG
ncbi:hypothetical protein THIX_90233 [Thiomonas sp. X19]|nr:hypothetical protein THIX_90233 [Thiomonas sp. X19]